MFKFCVKCKSEKPLSAFGKHKQRPGGVSCWCRECSRKSVETYRSKHPERVRETDRNRNLKHREKRNAEAKIRGIKYRAENKEKINLRQKKYYEANKDIINKKSKERKAANPGKVNAGTANRRATKLQATPVWINKAKVKEIYIKARRKKMQVDHIIPLRSNTVCGLHWEHNLQLLSPLANASKGNTYQVDV